MVLFRRTSLVFVALALLMLASCSRAFRVPQAELSPASEWRGLYRISTTTEHFTVREFSVTDSTIVITKLGGSDDRYGRVDMPLTIALQDVQSVERLETNETKTVLAVMGIVVVAVALVLAMTFSFEGLD